LRHWFTLKFNWEWFGTCICIIILFVLYIYEGHQNGCCLAYIGNTSNLDSNHHGGHCIYIFQVFKSPQHITILVWILMFVDNISSYHSVSPADTIIPPCHVPGTRSPSPLPSSRRTSCVSSSSTSASYPGSCPGPSQASGNRHEYDRTKLSIPLQRYFKTKILHFYIKSIKYFHYLYHGI